MLEKNTVEIRDLSVAYGKKEALSHLNLTVRPGLFGLLGRNGAGKTTLMRTLAGLLTPSGGKAVVCGVPLQMRAQIRQMTGYLPQDFNVYPSMRVEEALDYLGVLSGLPRRVRKERIPALLRRVNLEEQAGARVRALSGGMRRRLGIAQALLHDPRVLIVDEPTAGLDPEERIRFRNLLGEVASDRVVLLSTHIVGDIEAICENLAVLERGRLLYSGSVEGLAEQAQGQVYQVSVSRAQLEALKEQFSVTAALQEGRGFVARVLADRPPLPTAAPCMPGLEDGYLSLLAREKRGGGGR